MPHVEGYQSLSFIVKRKDFWGENTAGVKLHKNLIQIQFKPTRFIN